MNFPQLPSLYYSDKWCAIYHGNCKEILPQLNVKADLILTDPPYNVGKDYGIYNDKNPNYDEFSQQWFGLASDIAPLIVFTPGVVNFQDWIVRQRANWIASWQISNSVSRGGHIQFITWEPILIYGKIKTKIERDTYNVPIGFQDVGRLHPCPKPARLWDLLILDYSLPGETIIDPFLGSGTTCYCAKKLNRFSIGIEISEDYCEIAANRCRQSCFEFEPQSQQENQSNMELETS